MSAMEPDLPQGRSSATAVSIVLAGGMALFAGITLAITVLTSDPTPDKERLFVLLSLMLATALTAAALLITGRRAGSGLASAMRAFRRGALVGLACAGTIVLQLNASLTPANMAFLFLVLLIVEMIFLARRQDVAS